jgi:CBS domain-containing protein
MEGTTERAQRLDVGTVGDAMNRSVITLRPDMALGDAARMLERSGVAGAPVVRGDRVVGMVGRDDLMARARAISPHAQASGPFLRYEHVLDGLSPELTVAGVMTPQVITAGVDWPVGRAAATMEETGVNRLPVLDDEGRLVGIIARNDVIGAVARAARMEGSARPLLRPD